MFNKKILLLLTNPCLNDPRVEYHAQILTKSGFSAEIIAWDRTGNLPKTEERNNYKISRIHVKSKYSQGLKQIFKLIIFYIKVLKYIKTLDQYEIIHCNDLDTLPIGFYLKIFTKKKLVYDAHEIYSNMVFRNTLLKKLCIFFEKLMIKKSDIFFTVGKLRQDWYKNNKYPKTPVILGNWKNKIKIKIDVEKERKKIKVNNRIFILYIGSLNRNRNLLDLINEVKNDKRFYLLIAGEGTQKIKITEIIENIKNIKYIGFLDNREEIDKLTYLSDVIYYGLYENDYLMNIPTPNKMFEAIANDKIFLASDFGEINNINKINNAFITISDLKENLNQIYDAVTTKKIRREITNKNKHLYKLYNREKSKNIIISNYLSLD